MRALNSAYAQRKLVAVSASHYDDPIDFSQIPRTHMLASVSSNDRAKNLGSNDLGDLKSESLWERMMAAASRSFELLADSKARFPLDM
jgi:hypothetical protein